MKKKNLLHRKAIKALLAVTVLTLLFANCQQQSNSKRQPVIENGIIDLTNWDFKKDGIVELKGNWKFKWLEDDPDFSQLSYDDSNWETLSMPQYWNDATGTRFGYAWYRATIKSTDQNLGIFFSYAESSYEIYLNGKKVISNGVPGTDRSSTIPWEEPELSYLPLKGDAVIAWKISNFHSDYGGALSVPQIGLIEDILDKRWHYDLTNQIIFGVFIFVSLYHFVLWLGLRQNKASAYFSLFTLSITLYLVIFEHILNRFVSVPTEFTYELFDNLKKMPVFLGWIFVSTYLYEMYPKEVSKPFVRTSQISGIACLTFVLLTPSYINFPILPLFQIMLLIICFWLVISVVIAAFKKREGAFFILLGFGLLFVAILNDILHANNIISTVYMVPRGLLGFIVFQSFVLTNMFIRAYKTAEHLSVNLQQEVKNRTQELENANKAIEEQSRQKVNFFINVAHEIKTPLTLIRNNFEEHIKEVETTPAIQSVKRNVETLTQSVVNLLDSQKLERGDFLYDHSQVSNFSRILNDKFLLFKGMAVKKDIITTAHIDENLFIRADPFSLDRVINNLIENAIKYTDNGGEIHVELNNQKEEVLFRVTDTGIGIPQDQLKQVFDPYYQSSHRKRNSQGIGMGLYIVKKIVDSLHGIITINSKVGDGTSTQVALPRYQRMEEDHIDDYFETPKPIDIGTDITLLDTAFSATRKNLLIVEDNKEMIAYLQRNMGTKYNINYAFNGMDALRKISTIPVPDIIISDVMMDEMDGLSFYQELQNEKKYFHIPFIFLTAVSTHESKIEALETGAIDYIYKPFFIKELIAKVDSVLKNREESKEKITEELKDKLSRFFDAENSPVESDEASTKTDLFESICETYSLSYREREVTRELLAGKFDKEISAELSISTETVKSHNKSIFRKCNVSSRVELMRLFAKSI